MAAVDASKLAQRLQGLKNANEYWLHLEAAGPLEKYPAKQHARRVRDHLGLTRGLVYLQGEWALNNEDSDMPAPFRQHRYFFYMSGCKEADCHLTYDIQTDTLSLFIPQVDPQRVIWYGPGISPPEALDRYDIDAVYFRHELRPWLQAWIANNRGLVYVLHEVQEPHFPVVSGRLDSTSLMPAMNLARMIKDDHEIKMIRKANQISSQAHKEVLANILKFTNEAQVEGLFLDVCVSHHAKEQAYDIIAASGPNAGTLHYDANNEDFEDRQLMCLDAGCEYELYASDITRTFPLSGSWPTVEAERIYKLVQRMQDACIQKLAPGVRYLDLHIMAHQIAIEGLLQLGILHNGTKEEIYNAGTSRAFFPHGLGHHVGLEVHDVGQKELMSFPRFEKAPSLYPEDFHLPVYDKDQCRAPTDPQSSHLMEGMVVTVEPGIYFSDYALKNFYLPSPIHSKYINTDVLARYMPVGGVRIEDDILITSKGHENLTTAPKGEAMLEIIRSQNAKWPFVSQAPTPARAEVVLEEPQRRAPGISRKVSEPRLKALSRAATAPVERSGRRSSGDFEAFDGPSLFSGFQRTTTTEENVNRWKRLNPSHETSPNLTLCGETSSDADHLQLSLQSDLRAVNPFPRPAGFTKAKPACNKCVLLRHSLDLLRQTLKQSEKAPADRDPAPITRDIPTVATQARKQLQLPPYRRSTRADHHTNSQQTPFPSTEHRRTAAADRAPFSHRPIPDVAHVPTERPHRRSVTFDSYPPPEKAPASILPPQPTATRRPLPRVPTTRASMPVLRQPQPNSSDPLFVRDTAVAHAPRAVPPSPPRYTTRSSGAAPRSMVTSERTQNVSATAPDAWEQKLVHMQRAMDELWLARPGAQAARHSGRLEGGRAGALRGDHAECGERCAFDCPVTDGWRGSWDRAGV